MAYIGAGITRFNTADQLTVTGDATIDTTTLVVDSTNNRVGIGTSSPTSTASAGPTLEISGTAGGNLVLSDSNATTGQRAKYFLSQGGALYIGHSADNGTSPVNDLAIDGSGNVGIGTISPSTYGGKLNITDGAAGGETTLVVANNNANQFIRVGINANVAQIAYDDADSLAFGIATDSTTSGLTTEHMRITSGGNVGIGTSSPLQDLHISSTSGTKAIFERTGSTGAFIGLKDSSGSFVYLGDNNGTFEVQTAGSSYSTKLAVTSAGNVGIGTSSPSSYYANQLVVDTGSAVQSGITIVSDTGNQSMFAFADGTSGDQRYRGFLDYNHSNDVLSFGTAGGERMRIDSSGNVGIGTSLPTTVIDARQTSTGGSTQIKVYNTDNSNTTTQTAALFLSPDSRANGALIFAEKENADFSTSAGRDISLVFSPVLNNTQTERMRIDSSGALNGPPSANFAIKTGSGTGDMQFFTNGTQRATIDSSGNVGIQNSSPAYTFEVHDVNVTGSGNEQGFAVNSSASLYSSTNNTSQFYINDSSSSAGTHNYFVFRHQGTTIGDVDTTDNTTIRYNTFVGAHWSQTTAANIIRGTIMSTIDEMMQWTDFEFTNEEGDVEKLAMAGHADYVIGQEYTIPCDDDGNTVTATAVGQTTDKRLAKVKVSDVASDRSVYGVFGGQYADGDISVESLGASFVRIGSGVTVTNGDLIESAGDGTGRVQADDIMRSCTVAKITSTIAKETFADGSKLYPCTLHCG